MGRPKKQEGDEKAEYRVAEETSKENLGKIVKAFVRTFGRLEKLRENRRLTKSEKAVTTFNKVLAKLQADYGDVFENVAAYRAPSDDEDDDSEDSAFDIDAWISG